MSGLISFLRIVLISHLLTFGIFNSILFADTSRTWTNKSLTDQSVVINEIMYHPFHNANEPENIGDEYIEILNCGNQSIHLSGWQFNKGVDFVFPDISIHAGEYLVIALDVTEFVMKHPTITQVIGNWNGKLSNSGEKIKLENKSGETIDEVRYSDEGNWAVRQLGEIDNDHRGWEWSDEHDGEGRSLERINPVISIDSGQNWAASKVAGGTPGQINSVYQENTAPFIFNVTHAPVIPHSNEQVIVSASISDDPVRVRLFYRIDGQTNFNIIEMAAAAQIGYLILYTATIEAKPNGSIIEFYIEALDSAAKARTYPAPSRVDGSHVQACNLLYQVDDSFNNFGITEDNPVYRIVMTEKERAELMDVIGSGVNLDRESNAEMNATFISQDTKGVQKVYNTGVRVRGHGTRKRPPINLRINFPSDQLWKDLNAVNFNTKFTHLQVLGAAVFEKAGLTAANAKAVELLVNGSNLAFTDIIPRRMYGKYAYLEVINSDFTDRHFSGDGGGNIYKCMRTEDDTEADLRYEGADPLAYINTYFKKTNTSEFDWTDLIHLTDVLNNAPDESYVQAVSSVIDVDQWLRWFAIEAMFSNYETNLSSGQGDDYYMYRGENDSRFILLPYDLDTILGQGGERVPAFGLSIWQPAQIAAIYRFLTHPLFITRYYAQLMDVIETIFEPHNFSNLIDEVLGEWAQDEPDLSDEIGLIKQFVADRSKYILYGGYPRAESTPQIPNYKFAIECNLPLNGRYYYTSSSIFSGPELRGTADVMNTRSVMIDSVLAGWNPIYGEWQLPMTQSLNLIPGLNHIVVSTYDNFNGKGNKLQSGTLDIWYDKPVLSGILTADLTLNAESNPIYVIGDVVVPDGVTLTINPGVFIYFSQGAGVVIQQGGRLLAEGDEQNRILLSGDPDSVSQWKGIEFNHSQEENCLCYVDIKQGDQTSQIIHVNKSRLLIDHVVWDSTYKKVLELLNPSLVVRESVFPPVTNEEAIHGRGLAGSEYCVIQSNTFNRPTGYNDVIDFSNCKRPGPILQVLDNFFLGGDDDGLDLDGCDAHIEGNQFINFHKGHEESTSTSNAIATGASNGLNSSITVVRNIFYNNDHAILLKEDAFLQAENNVFVHCKYSAINFSEYPARDVEPGKGALLDGCIFWNNPEAFENQFAQPGEQNPEITVHQSIIESDYHGLGEGNLDIDPQFFDASGNFHLTSLSPAIGMGPNGLDIGAYVPAGASISGEPDSLTSTTQVILTVGGPGITHYSYSIGDTTGPWSEEISIERTPKIQLNDLTDGTKYIVYVKGKNSANVWQHHPDFTASKSWKVELAYIHEPELPQRFLLHQNYPNPFNQSTIITFEVPENVNIKMIIYDLIGREVRTLADGFFDAGVLEFVWNGQNDKGYIVPTGIYTLRIRTDKKVFTKKMLLL